MTQGQVTIKDTPTISFYFPFVHPTELDLAYLHFICSLSSAQRSGMVLKMKLFLFILFQEKVPLMMNLFEINLIEVKTKRGITNHLTFSRTWLDKLRIVKSSGTYPE